jgi:hypothetical protein
MSPVSIIRWVAIAIAVVSAFVAIPYGGLAMVVLGAALGFMGVSADERVLYLVVAVALGSVAGGLGAIPAVGEYITEILTNISTIVSAGAATVILVMTKERLMD